MNLIEKWILDGCDWEEGKKLFFQYGNNPRLENRISKFGKDPYNINVLRDELGLLKFSDSIPEAEEIEQKAKPIKEESKIQSTLRKSITGKKLDELIEITKDFNIGVNSKPRTNPVSKKVGEIKTVRSNYHREVIKRANKLTDPNLSTSEANRLIDEGEFLTSQLKDQSKQIHNQFHPDNKKELIQDKPIRERRKNPDLINVESMVDPKLVNMELSKLRRRLTQSRNGLKKSLNIKKKLNPDELRDFIKARKSMPAKASSYWEKVVQREALEDALINQFNKLTVNAN